MERCLKKRKNALKNHRPDRSPGDGKKESSNEA